MQLFMVLKENIKIYFEFDIHMTFYIHSIVPPIML